ncbi:hypothetical protein C5167_022700, partial [Papaver somniferum]
GMSAIPTVTIGIDLSLNAIPTGTIGIGRLLKTIPKDKLEMKKHGDKDTDYNECSGDDDFMKPKKKKKTSAYDDFVKSKKKKKTEDSSKDGAKGR